MRRFRFLFEQRRAPSLSSLSVRLKELPVGGSTLSSSFSFFLLSCICIYHLSPCAFCR